MRIVQADLTHAYPVHKTFMEYQNDVGERKIPEKEVYQFWTKKLTSPDHKYFLLMHSRKVVGMVWGKVLKDETPEKFLLEGRFLRKAYRGKLKFSREFLVAVKEITKDFSEVLMLLPESCRKIPKKYRVVGTLVSLGGSNG